MHIILLSIRVSAGLPNITGGWVGGRNGNEGVWGVIYGANTYGTYGGGNYHMGPKTLDASRASTIYGSSNTVRPLSLSTYYYIKY